MSYGVRLHGTWELWALKKCLAKAQDDRYYVVDNDRGWREYKVISWTVDETLYLYDNLTTWELKL